jgi:hypothetical protein
MKIDARKIVEPGASNLRSDPLPPASASAATATREAFDKALRNRRVVNGQSLRGQIEALTRVQVQDPAIFSAHRTQQILEHLIDVIVPQLGADPMTEHVALDLLREELQHYRDIEACLDAGNPL